ncbi:MAG: hypothetical protein NTY23_11610, partial [Chloroflexi bacterium]|nr:hypothetical protein [Chloroflexota bacterium]
EPPSRLRRAVKFAGALAAVHRAYGVLATVVVALAFLACGLMTTFYFAPKEARRYDEVRLLRPIGVAGLDALSMGGTTLLKGTLFAKPVIGAQGLVAFRRERWVVERDSEGSLGGRWTLLQTQVPELMLSTSDGTVRMGRGQNEILSGKRHATTVLVPHDGRVADGVVEGTERVIGFINGDKLTVVGEWVSSGLALSRLYGGSAARMQLELLGGVMLFYACGTVMLILVPVIIWAGLTGRGTARLSIGRS